MVVATPLGTSGSPGLSSRERSTYVLCCQNSNIPLYLGVKPYGCHLDVPLKRSLQRRPKLCPTVKSRQGICVASAQTVGETVQQLAMRPQFTQAVNLTHPGMGITTQMDFYSYLSCRDKKYAAGHWLGLIWLILYKLVSAIQRQFSIGYYI